MRIRGWFTPEGEPFVDVIFLCPNLGIRRIFSFMIDTGSYQTSLGEEDSGRLGIDLENLKKKESELVGIGGLADAYIMDNAHLVFETEDGGHHAEHLEFISILETEGRTEEETEALSSIPSLLGRDITDKFCVVVCLKKDIVILTDETPRLFSFRSFYRRLLPSFS